MQTSHYGISKENRPTNNKSYRYNRTAQRYDNQKITLAWGDGLILHLEKEVESVTQNHENNVMTVLKFNVITLFS
jgi:hypothetical protein